MENKYQDALDKVLADNPKINLTTSDIHSSIRVLQELINQTKTPIGEISDGYHTFNELYYHRTVLFSIICNANKDKAYKSHSHYDGTMYDDMFIAVINTPKGQYSYHCENKYWNLFDIPTKDKAEEWDVHQPKDIERLYSLYDELVNPLEEVKKEWKEFGYVCEEGACHLVLRYKGTNNMIQIWEDHTYRVDDWLTFQEHQLLTKTFKALGWEG